MTRRLEGAGAGSSRGQGGASGPRFGCGRGRGGLGQRCAASHRPLCRAHRRHLCLQSGELPSHELHLLLRLGRHLQRRRVVLRLLLQHLAGFSGTIFLLHRGRR